MHFKMASGRCRRYYCGTYSEVSWLRVQLHKPFPHRSSCWRTHQPHKSCYLYKQISCGFVVRGRKWVSVLLKIIRDNSILSKTSLIAWILFNLSNEWRFTDETMVQRSGGVQPWYWKGSNCHRKGIAKLSDAFAMLRRRDKVKLETPPS